MRGWSSPRRETSTASGSATRRANRATAARRTTSSAKASAPPRHCTGHTTANTTSTRALPAYSTPGSGAGPMDQRVVIKMVVAALQNRDIVVNGSGEQLRTFCWVEDLVEGLVRLMETPPSAGAVRTVNLGSNHEISIRALAEKIVALTGSRSRIVHTAARADDARRRAPDISAARRSWAGCPGHRSQKGCAARSAMRKRSWRTKPTPGSHGRR